MGHLKPSAAGNAKKREGEGAGRAGESRGAGRRERDAFARSSGAAGPCPAPGAAAACSLRQRLQLGLIAAKASLCSARGRPVRAVSSRFPNVAAFQSEPVPSGEPLSHLFSSVRFFFFFSFGSEVLESHLEPGAWLTFFFFPLAPRRGGLREKAEDAEDKPFKAADYKLVGQAEKRKT